MHPGLAGQMPKIYPLKYSQLAGLFKNMKLAQALHHIRRGRNIIEEKIMRVRLGNNLLVLEASKSLFAWFQGETQRMRLTSFSLMFVQLSVFAHRAPAF
jgi:hypothetical protein